MNTISIPKNTIDYADMYNEYTLYLKTMKTVLNGVAIKGIPHCALLIGTDGQLWIAYRDEFGSVFRKVTIVENAIGKN